MDYLSVLCQVPVMESILRALGGPIMAGNLRATCRDLCDFIPCHGPVLVSDLNTSVLGKSLHVGDKKATEIIDERRKSNVACIVGNQRIVETCARGFFSESEDWLMEKFRYSVAFGNLDIARFCIDGTKGLHLASKPERANRFYIVTVLCAFGFYEEAMRFYKSTKRRGDRQQRGGRDRDLSAIWAWHPNDCRDLYEYALSLSQGTATKTCYGTWLDEKRHAVFADIKEFIHYALPAEYDFIASSSGPFKLLWKGVMHTSFGGHLRVKK